MAKRELRVNHTPCLGKDAAYCVMVDSVAEGVRMMEVISQYDLFLTRNGLMPDVANVCELEEFIDGEWESVDVEDEKEPA